MTKEEGKEFANALKNNYTIDFGKLPDFCDLVISVLEKNESAGEWYKLLCEKWDSAEKDITMEWKGVYDRTEVGDICIERLCGFECSGCNKQADHMYNFCPHCGRKAVFE